MKFLSPLGSRVVKPASKAEVRRLQTKIETNSLTPEDKHRIWELEEDEIRRKWSSVIPKKKGVR